MLLFGMIFKNRTICIIRKSAELVAVLSNQDCHDRFNKLTREMITNCFFTEIRNDTLHKLCQLFSGKHTVSIQIQILIRKKVSIQITKKKNCVFFRRSCLHLTKKKYLYCKYQTYDSYFVSALSIHNKNCLLDRRITFSILHC